MVRVLCYVSCMRPLNQEKIELERMYLKEHMTLEEIGAKLGISRQGVLYRMRKNRVDMRNGERFFVSCAGCGVKFQVTRARWKKAREVYHDDACRVRSLRGKAHHSTTTAPAGADATGVLVDVPKAFLDVEGESAFEDLGYKR